VLNGLARIFQGELPRGLLPEKRSVGVGADGGNPLFPRDRNLIGKSASNGKDAE
jgi:hypothetical protein